MLGESREDVLRTTLDWYGKFQLIGEREFQWKSKAELTDLIPL